MKRNGTTNSGNYIRATLIKVKIPVESNLTSFLLRMEFNNQSQETDKLTGKEIELKKVSFLKYHNFLLR
jgi:hypothetical protein